MSQEGDILNPLLVVVTFLGIFVFIVALVMAESPTMFIDPSEEYAQYDVPEQFSAIDMLYYVEKVNKTIEDKMLYNAFELGGWNFELFTNADHEDTEIWIVRGERWSFFSWGWHHMTWENEKGFDVSTYSFHSPYLACETIDDYYSMRFNASKFICKNDVMQFHAFFNYDHGTYSNCSEALKNDALYLLACLEFDQQNTGMNAWSLMGMLLSFQLPSVHPIINFFITLPIWVCIIWIVVVIVLAIIKSLPFT